MDTGLTVALICLMLLPIIPLTGLLISSFKDDFDMVSTYNYITFDRFVAFYNINPDRWSLFGDYVVYRKNYSYFSDTVEFHFIFLEHCKYKRWRKHLEQLEAKNREQRLKKARLEEYQEVLECVKKDLEKFNRKNDEMMKREAEKYAKVADEAPRMFEDKSTAQAFCGATGLSCSSCSLDPCALRIAEYRKR